jgi:hypothetical protein
MQMPTEPFGPRIMTNTGIPHNSFFLLIWHPCSGSASSHSTSRARSSVVRFFFFFTYRLTPWCELSTRFAAST